ncbi:unnamed protein product [Cylindrotheca closterium]|uniref:C2H2-type domain-containing protein n=1 Tax=Cylindrotheca closterium TaxID=2856 RepID=A0AAD2JL16_9STRA|nr:unnamed protein product [Cylindrotheca closterium]
MTSTQDDTGSLKQCLLDDTVLEHVLPFLHAPELASVARTNRHFFQLVMNHDTLWASTYEHWNRKYRLAPLRVLTQDDFYDPDNFVRIEMRIPLRPRRWRTIGESANGDDGIGHDDCHDVNYYQSTVLSLQARQPRRYCHDENDANIDNTGGDCSKCLPTALEYSNDVETIDMYEDDKDDCPIYFMDHGVYCHWRVDEYGNLLDSPSGNSSQWSRREYPVLCEDCGVKLHTTEDLVNHCTSPLHIYCKCPVLLDPRRTADFEYLSRYEKAKAIWHYPKQAASFYRQLGHQPPNQYRMHQYFGLLEGTIAFVLQRDSIADSSKHLYPERTVQRVSDYCVEWIVHKALHYDFFNHAKQVAYAGWQAVDFYESGLGYDLCLFLTGIPDHHFDFLLYD